MSPRFNPAIDAGEFGYTYSTMAKMFLELVKTPKDGENPMAKMVPLISSFIDSASSEIYENLSDAYNRLLN